MLQGAVAGFMAVFIVDGLEVVQVQQQHAETAGGFFRQLDLAAQHGRQKATVQQVGQRIATGIELADALEQHAQQGTDLADFGTHFLQLDGTFGRCTVLLQGVLQQLVDLADQAADLHGLRTFAETGDALVVEPQAELRTRQALEAAQVGLCGQRVQQGVLPIQQQGTLAFALGADVLHQ